MKTMKVTLHMLAPWPLRAKKLPRPPEAFLFKAHSIDRIQIAHRTHHQREKNNHSLPAVLVSTPPGSAVSTP